jgi:hypothetical protein
VSVGQIYVLIILINSNFDLFIIFFLIIAIYIKATNT